MSNLKTYRVTADWFGDAEVTLRVNHDVLTKELASEINGFWSGDDRRLADEGDDSVRTVIRMFGAAAIRFFMDDGGRSLGPSKDGDRYWTGEVLKAQVEGWPDLDSLGILIVAAEVSAVYYDDVELKVVP